MLSETQNFSQSLDLTFRTPTGSERTGNNIGAFSLVYNFLVERRGGLVLRGGVGGFVPFSGPNTRESFIANLVAGYYFTPHDLLPIGDLVWYVSTNLKSADGRRGCGYSGAKQHDRDLHAGVPYPPRSELLSPGRRRGPGDQPQALRLSGPRCPHEGVVKRD
jgi:hypothetical protein